VILETPCRHHHPGLVFVAVGVDDRFQLVAELWFTSASIDGLELGLFGSVQYLADELLVRRVDVQMRQGEGSDTSRP